MNANANGNLLPLKVLVISLGLVLLGGFVFVSAVVFGKMGPGRGCISKAIDLPVQGKVVGITPDPKTWRLTVRTTEGLALVTVDACSGAVINTLTVR